MGSNDPIGVLWTQIFCDHHEIRLMYLYTFSNYKIQYRDFIFNCLESNKWLIFRHVTCTKIGE